MMSFRKWIVLALVLALIVLGVSAQDAQSRALNPGVPVSGAISAAAPAQTYTFVADGQAPVSLAVTADVGLALTAVVTDAAGNLVAQAVDPSASGSLELAGIPISSAGVYYVTLFPAASAESTSTTGNFTITLAADTTAPAATAEPTTEAATPEVTTPSTPQPFSVGQYLTNLGIQVSLSWGNTSDLNLQIRDPSGQTLFFDSRATNNGGSFGFDVNGLCEIKTADNPTETATYAPGAVPTGSYEILVFYRQDCDNVGATPFTLNATVDGQELGPITATLAAPVNNNSSVYIASFKLGTDGSVDWATSGPYQDTRVLPKPASDYVAEPATPVTFGQPLRGVITSEQYYQLYSFEVESGASVSVSMTAQSGNLDTLLLVLNRAGQIIGDNDDILVGDNTNSSISNPPLNIVTAGVYTVIATRYGKDVGGTEGEFELIVDRGAADLFTESFAQLNLAQGDIEVYLQWATNADLQLLVRGPDGQAVYDDRPQVNSGGQLLLTGNRDCTIFAGGPTPLYYTYWPFGAARGGSYEVEVWYQNQCNDTRPVNATLFIRVRGVPIFNQTFALQQGQRFISSFTIDAANNVTTGGAGISGGSETIPFTPDEVAAAPEIVTGQTQRGNIDANNEYDLFVFEGTAGQAVTIGMRKTQGILDTKMFLISPSGFEVADNDDSSPGETTDSLIQNFTLPETGRYVIVATKFGTVYGATSGSYELTLQIAASTGE